MVSHSNRKRPRLGWGTRLCFEMTPDPAHLGQELSTNRSGDLADGEGGVVPVAVEGDGLGIGDEDPIDAELGFEALEVG